VLMNKLVQAHENEANHIEKEVKSMFRSCARPREGRGGGGGGVGGGRGGVAAR
jgi:hypothetical protein